MVCLRLGTCKYMFVCFVVLIDREREREGENCFYYFLWLEFFFKAKKKEKNVEAPIK